MACLVDLKDANRDDLLELRFCLEGIQDGKVSELMDLLGLQLYLKNGAKMKIGCFTQNFQKT